MGKGIKAYLDQRAAKVAHLVHTGKSERQIAKLLGVSRTTVWNDKQRLGITR